MQVERGPRGDGEEREGVDLRFAALVARDRVLSIGSQGMAFM